MGMKDMAARMKRASRIGVHFQEFHFQKELGVFQIKWWKQELFQVEGVSNMNSWSYKKTCIVKHCSS